ncbi:hypothetical protein MTO96_026065 [Rhipicephalus appendiculatus]
MRRRRARAKNPYSAKPSSFPKALLTSKTWIGPARPSQDGDSAVVIVRGEAEEDPSKSDSMDVDDGKTRAWIDAPIKGSRGTSPSITSSLIQATTSKGVDTDAWAQNVTAVNE